MDLGRCTEDCTWKCSGLTGDWSKVEGAWLSPVTGLRKISIDGSQRNVCLTLVGKYCSGNWREDVQKTTGRNESGKGQEFLFLRVDGSCRNVRCVMGHLNIVVVVPHPHQAILALLP